MAANKITKQVNKKPTKAAAKKVTKKTSKPPTPPKKPVITEAMYHKWFYELDQPTFVYMCEQWNKKSLKIKLPRHTNYDQWLNYFKTLPPNTIKILSTSGLDILPTEAYAALSRWHDIIKSPHRIDKIHQSGLTNDSQKQGANIIELARKNDRMGVLCAVRDEIAQKLAKGAGARDTAALAREMGDILDQIAELERRSGPKKNTKLAELMNTAPAARAAGKGARNTSFKSRITIDDTEDA